MGEIPGQPLRQAQSRPPQKMTYEEFLAWADEDTLAEWLDGEVVMYTLGVIIGALAMERWEMKLDPRTGTLDPSTGSGQASRGSSGTNSPSSGHCEPGERSGAIGNSEN